MRRSAQSSKSIPRLNACSEKGESFEMGKQYCSTPSPILDSLVVRISACHVEGPGSIPGRGVNLFLLASLSRTVLRQATWHHGGVPLGHPKASLSTNNVQEEVSCPGSSVGRALGF